MATRNLFFALTILSLATFASGFSASFNAQFSLRSKSAVCNARSATSLLPQSRITVGRAISSLRMSSKNPILSSIDKVVKENKIIVFMKGTKDIPQCGFSNTVVQILKATGAQFETVNVLENPLLRQGIKEYTNWPTIPQVFIGGEFIGGCDIMTDLYQSGELVELVEKTMAE